MTPRRATLLAQLVVLLVAALCGSARVLAVSVPAAAVSSGKGARRRELWSAQNLELCSMNSAEITALGSQSTARRCDRLIHNYCRRPGYLAFLRGRADRVASSARRLEFCNGLLYEKNVCPKILAHGISSALSSCEREDVLSNNLDREVICSEVSDYPTCQEMDGCIWRELVPDGGVDARSASSGGDRRALQNQPGAGCVADPCFRINNGRCTLQHTGGRCVWYTLEQNLALRGVENAGCYVNPCNNVKRRNFCEKHAGNDFYKCVWCGKMNGTPYGCQAARSESYAQCFNIGAYEDRCSDCMPRRRDMHVAKLNADCSTTTCAQQCCDSPYCTCGTIRTTENTGLNIITSG